MDLNSVLFPAPKSSYKIGRVHGELMWIPKNFADYEEAGDRLHTAPDLSRSPKRRDLPFERFKFENSIIAKTKPNAKHSGSDVLTSPTTSSRNFIPLADVSKRYESLNFQASVVKTDNCEIEESKRLDFSSSVQENVLLLKQAREEDYDSADDKTLGPEEEPLSKLPVHYSKTPNPSQLDRRLGVEKRTRPTTKRIQLTEMSTKNGHVFNDPFGTMITNKAFIYDLTQNYILNKNIQVIKNNLYFKANPTECLNAKDKIIKQSNRAAIN